MAFSPSFSLFEDFDNSLCQLDGSLHPLRLEFHRFRRIVIIDYAFAELNPTLILECKFTTLHTLAFALASIDVIFDDAGKLYKRWRKPARQTLNRLATMNNINKK